MWILKIVLFPILLPIAVIYGIVSLVRNIFYDLKIFSTQQISNAKIISVGNITAGGTGKTPVTAFLVESLLARGRSVGIISRGYRGQYSAEFAPVDLGANHPALLFGDEPTWFKKRFAQVPVWVGRDKSKTASALLRASHSEMIVADDAFQHRKLKRDVDIVIIDASVSRLDYLPIPLGRGREDFALAVRRADLIVLNKINLVAPKQVEKIHALIDIIRKKNTKIFNVETHIEYFSLLKSSERVSLEGKTLFLASAIARPEQFLNLVKFSTGSQIVGRIELKDHDKFESAAIEKIESMARAANAQYIVVTEKDAVKLAGVEFTLPVVVSHLKLSAPGFADEVYSRIIR